MFPVLQALNQALETHAYCTDTHTHTPAVIVQFSVFDIFWSPLGASAADVMGGTSLTLSAVLAFFPLKCQASSVLRCSTVYLLPLLSTPLIDAICAVITPLVIKQHFSLPVSGCQALLPRGVLFFFRSTADNDSNLPKQIAWEGGFRIARSSECKEKVLEQFAKKGKNT